jgi:hypothetical protein
MGILTRIRNLIHEIATRETTTPKPAPQAVVREFSGMRQTNQTANIGGNDYPVYLERGSNQPHALMSPTLFVPLRVFNKR